MIYELRTHIDLFAYFKFLNQNTGDDICFMAYDMKADVIMIHDFRIHIMGYLVNV